MRQNVGVSVLAIAVWTRDKKQTFVLKSCVRGVISQLCSMWWWGCVCYCSRIAAQLAVTAEMLRARVQGGLLTPRALNCMLTYAHVRVLNSVTASISQKAVLKSC